MLERDECNGYSFEVDAWACGVIMYTLLAGCPPFWHRKQLTMIRLIMEGRYSFSSPEWSSITDETKDLISRLLVVDPEKRYSIEQALEHSVFKASRPHILDDTKPNPEATKRGGNRKRLGFNGRRTMRVALLSVRFLIRFQRLRFTPEPLSLHTCRFNPYCMRMIRKVIDNSAFRIYNHWVKKGEGQNRGALFEHFPRKELALRM